MGVILTLMLIVGDYNSSSPNRTAIAVSHQRFASKFACEMAGEQARFNAELMTPRAAARDSQYATSTGFGARVFYFCTPEG